MALYVQAPPLGAGKGLKDRGGITRQKAATVKYLSPSPQFLTSPSPFFLIFFSDVKLIKPEAHACSPSGSYIMESSAVDG